ncbi:ABC transporter ATP-binding protein [Variovorax sp. J2P1-59]|uniref:ABC transporter ATP-binding protein n=1 Tax=Variovorax flavidus TaxID=3053501 RepID=UPI002577EA2E|nr:ABC transporter ATP-binding protein [Variovorax sp. J2P1-59]MDM0078118.1 ABC transporter ATP-binding protein [Variovorax sp. J2P1-59]
MTSPAGAPALLAAHDLRVSFDERHGRIDALRGVSLHVQPGEVLAVVGESGSGKSTLARALLGMVPVRSGTLSLASEHLPPSAATRSVAQRRQLGMVFQDSMAALDPRFTVERILREPIALLDRGDTRRTPSDSATIAALLDAVGLSAALLQRRPHELSGGQRQRVGIARALAGDPKLLICDEAVSALDVSVQAQILNLLVDLQSERRLAMIFITHDLSVVSYIADRITVMYQGELLETGDVDQILDRPRHAYTQRLLAAAL